MPNLLLVAAKLGYQTREFARRAEHLGYSLQLATDRCHRLDDPWGDHAIPLKFDGPERAAKALCDIQVDGIVAVGDRPAFVAAHIAASLGLPFHSPDAVAASRNKFEARRRFASAGLPVPLFQRIPLDTRPEHVASQVPYPSVLKPLSLSASRGVIRINNPHEFVAAFRRIQAILASPDIVRMHEDQDRYILSEEFIPGREFAVEGLVTAGHLQVLAVFDKPDPLDGPFFEETIYITPSRELADVQDRIRCATAAAVRALGLSHGPIHAEMRVNERGVWMLEVAARPIGGLCAAALKFGNGTGLEDIVLRHAAGELSHRVELADPARGVPMIPIPREGVYKGTSGIEDAAAVPGVEDVIMTAKEGHRLVPLPEGSSYLGFIFARGASPAQVEQSLRTAHAKLDFEIAGVLPVV